MNTEKIIKQTTGSLWNYYRGDPSDPLSTNSESFRYKASIVGNTSNVDSTIIDDGGNQISNLDYDANKVGTQETENVIPLKYLSNFWRGLDILLINCEVELILTWSKNCVLADMTVANNPPTGLEFQITDNKITKLYVLVVTLSKENNKKLLEKLKSGFKKTIKWNKHRSQFSIQNNNDNLNYLIDPVFTNVNRLFLLSFERTEDHKDNRDSFSHYYALKVQIKDLNVLVDGRGFFDLP